MDNKYGAITEQGDLGLGFTVLSEQDQEVLENKKQSSNDKEEIENEQEKE